MDDFQDPEAPVERPALSRRRRPVVGITGASSGGAYMWRFARWLIRAAGGCPRRLTPTRGTLEELDAVIIGGGADVAPALYGGEPAPARAARLDPRRDRFELEVLSHADHASLPVLGICRGAQLMNVYAGGTLRKRVIVRANSRSVWPRRSVCIEPETVLHDVLRTDTCLVNSLHDYAVAKVGENLRIGARYVAGGGVQAIEHRQKPFWIGVQWHPELIPQLATQRRLFHTLVERAAA